ncbi:GNAT family acetyltransferase [Halobacteriales archaeon QS_8_69_26]|nr:MAG: GNAT family acetyltransferase [Halobacteriales archaeon QS_8_69_26]
MDVRTNDGKTVYVDRTDGERGSEGAFLVAYLSPDRERRYGWLCTNCDTFDNAMDSMGRIECNVCGNFRKPTEWDAAHE